MLRFMDSCDHYATADIPEKWNANAGGVVVSAGNGRRGTASLRCQVNASVQKTLDNQPTWVLGWAVRTQGFSSADMILAQLFDGGTVQLGLHLDSIGRLVARRGTGTVLGTSTFALQTTVFYYLELLGTIHGTTGAVTVRVDGVPVIALTNVNTQMSANAYANALYLGYVGGSVGGGNVDIDDIYICDGTGSAPQNTFLGDVRIDVLLPVADGTYTAWTPSTGVTHSVLVDEIPPNDATDYLSTSTSGARESHQMQDAPALPSPTIFGVQHVISATKDEVGTRQMKSLLKSGATTQVGPTTHTLASTYAYYREVWDTDPGTGVAWTIAGINAVEAGFEHV